MSRADAAAARRERRARRGFSTTPPGNVLLLVSEPSWSVTLARGVWPRSPQGAIRETVVLISDRGATIIIGGNGALTNTRDNGGYMTDPVAGSQTTQRDPLFIRDLIRRVHRELYASQQERELAGEAAIFEVDGLELEVNFVITESRDREAGLDLKVITAGAAKHYESQQVHKITLSMSAISAKTGGTSRPDADGLVDLEAQDTTAFRPRR